MQQEWHALYCQEEKENVWEGVKLEEDVARCRRKTREGHGKRMTGGLEGHLREAWDQHEQKERPAWYGEGQGSGGLPVMKN